MKGFEQPAHPFRQPGGSPEPRGSRVELICSVEGPEGRPFTSALNLQLTLEDPDVGQFARVWRLLR